MNRFCDLRQSGDNKPIEGLGGSARYSGGLAPDEYSYAAGRSIRASVHSAPPTMTSRPQEWTKVDLKPKKYHGYAVLLCIMGTLVPPLGRRLID